MTAPSRPDIATRLGAAGCVFAEEEAALLVAAARSPGDLADMVDRRATGEPLEYVVGWAEFAGLRIVVDPGVFVPRRRTELMVREAVSVALLVSRRTVVVDLCCGSGAVGVAVATMLDRVELHAADVDPLALRCARRNVAPMGGQVHEGNLYDALPGELRGRVDVLVANAPYVPTRDIGLLPPEARLYEANVALDGGRDGLDVVRRVASGALEWLAPGGHLLVEASAQQVPLVTEACVRSGLTARVARSEDLDATVVIGTPT